MNLASSTFAGPCHCVETRLQFKMLLRSTRLQKMRERISMGRCGDGVAPLVRSMTMGRCSNVVCCGGWMQKGKRGDNGIKKRAGENERLLYTGSVDHEDLMVPSLLRSHLKNGK